MTRNPRIAQTDQRGPGHHRASRPVRRPAALASGQPSSSERASRLRISLANETGARVALAPLRRFIGAVAGDVGLEEGELSIALVTDRRIAELNASYRRREEPTDVLSFPCEMGPVPASWRNWGDIVISLDTARRQAAALGHPFVDELRILALHGLLHLAGYDHHRDKGEMRRVELELRWRHGLPASLIGRSGRELLTAAPDSIRRQSSTARILPGRFSADRGRFLKMSSSRPRR